MISRVITCKIIRLDGSSEKVLRFNLYSTFIPYLYRFFLLNFTFLLWKKNFYLKLCIFEIVTTYYGTFEMFQKYFKESALPRTEVFE